MEDFLRSIVVLHSMDCVGVLGQSPIHWVLQNVLDLPHIVYDVEDKCSVTLSSGRTVKLIFLVACGGPVFWLCV
jgi:hypothetical protein